VPANSCVPEAAKRWCYIFGDLILWVPSNAPYDLSIYHIDDEYSFSPTEVEMSSAERTLLTSVDQVFIHSPGLMEKKGLFNPNTEFVPNGVSYASFATPGAEPDDLRDIPHPRASAFSR
jgi:hypothetical protein